jgi:hypothetical protein
MKSFESMCDTCDLFAVKVSSQFNLNNRSQIGTPLGVCYTLWLIIVTLTYAYVKQGQIEIGKEGYTWMDLLSNVGGFFYFLTIIG